MRTKITKKECMSKIQIWEDILNQYYIVINSNIDSKTRKSIYNQINNAENQMITALENYNGRSKAIRYMKNWLTARNSITTHDVNKSMSQMEHWLGKYRKRTQSALNYFF